MYLFSSFCFSNIRKSKNIVLLSFGGGKIAYLRKNHILRPRDIRKPSCYAHLSCDRSGGRHSGGNYA